MFSAQAALSVKRCLIDKEERRAEVQKNLPLQKKLEGESKSSVILEWMWKYMAIIKFYESVRGYNVSTAQV